MLEKIRKAAFEGNLLVKTIRFVFAKIPVLIVNKIDWLAGCLIRYIYAAFIKVNPKQIMFIPFQGDYTCNPKYILQKLLETENDFDIVFSARKASLQNRSAYPACVRLVEQYSAEFYKEIIKSRMIVANSVEFLKKPTPKKKSQIIIETWHGSLGIKKFDAKVNSGKSWVAAAKRCGKRADYIISNSAFEDGVYRGSYWKRTPILRYGHPRNDILLSDHEKTVQDIRRSILGLRRDLYEHKFVLYAPTFRDSQSLDSYDIDFEQLCAALKIRFGGDWTVLLRLHPTVREKAKKYISGQNTIDVTSYKDIQELMLISDIAITDYSSWIYDFMLTRRPGFIYATDIDDYENERGLYYPLSSTPFPIATGNEELMNNVLEFDQEKYEKELSAFLLDKGSVEDGHAAERVVEKLKEIMGTDT